jgi:hypothetical protein
MIFILPTAATYSNSTLKFLPTALAARRSVASVTDPIAWIERPIQLPSARNQTPFIPAQAGIQGYLRRFIELRSWVPAFAGTNG